MKINKLEEAKIKKLKKLLNEGSINEKQFKAASKFFKELYFPGNYKLTENKTSQLKKLLNAGNIDEDQFKTADDFFKKYNSYEKEIDWGRGLDITWDDLEKVIKKERNTKSQTKKKIRKGLEGFKEGEDYLVLEETSNYVAYQPFTWEASRMIASHYVEPSKNEKGDLDDAGWCTAYQKDKTYWDIHDDIEAFIYICGEFIPSKKVAISISEEEYDASGSKFLYYLGDLNFNIWDFEDYNYTIEEDELLEAVPNLHDLIEKSYNIWQDKHKESNISKLKLNLKTNRYDYEGSLGKRDLAGLVSKDRNGFTINFGAVTGDFDCSNMRLTSLKGAPQTTGGSFLCYNNQLTSLKGAPQTVGGYFDCSQSNLTSLEGAPQTVVGSFECSQNNLTSLEGGPQTVVRKFNCRKNHLTSLKGSPQTVGGFFDCSENHLTSLEGVPREVGGEFDCSINELISLKGAPQTVGGYFDCSENHLTSLKGSPQTIEGNFYCKSNPDLHSLEGIGKVKGKIYKDF